MSPERIAELRAITFREVATFGESFLTDHITDIECAWICAEMLAGRDPFA